MSDQAENLRHLVQACREWREAAPATSPRGAGVVPEAVAEQTARPGRRALWGASRDGLAGVWLARLARRVRWGTAR